MLNIIKSSYVLFAKKISLWLALVAPLIVFSCVDSFFFDGMFSIGSWQIVGILILVATELVLYHYMLKIDRETVWSAVKKIVLTAVVQVVMGVVMMIPVYIFMNIAYHHNFTAGALWLGMVINIFLGGWLFAKVSSLIALIVTNEKLSWARFREFSKASYKDWAFCSALVYFPYVLFTYLPINIYAGNVITAVLLVVLCTFNSSYYLAKK